MAAAETSPTRRDRDALYAELLAQHKTQLFRYVFAIVQSLPDAEDVFQQAAITMWDKFGQFEPGTDFYAWACSIARFKALDFFKAKGRQRLYFSDSLLDAIAERNQWPPEQQQAKLQALEKCRQKLSDSDQRLLAECYGGQGTIRDAARQIGRPVGSVYDSLSRIRRALYLCIQRTLANEGQV